MIVSGLRGYEAAKKRAERSGVRMHRSAKAGGLREEYPHTIGKNFLV